MEQIDVFTAQGHPLPMRYASIDCVHQQGLWHQTFACWLVCPQKNKICLQLRGPNNRVDASSFDASASGHLSAGESPVNGFREVYEELGVCVQPENQFYLGDFNNQVKRGSYINNEWCHTYMACIDLNLKDFSLQKGEVSGLFLLDIDEGIDLFSHKRQFVWIDGIAYTGTAYIPCHRKIEISDFCAYKERQKNMSYYLHIFKNAKRLVDEKPLVNLKKKG